MAKLGLAVVGISLASQAFGEGLLKWPGEWKPFLERIDSREFLAVEHKFGESLSDTSDLVIYDAQDFTVGSSITLSRKPGKGCRLEIANRDYRTSLLQRKAVLLPTDIAERLFAVMELVLTTQLYPPTGRAISYPTESGAYKSLWINLRVDRLRRVSGVVLLERCGVGQESSRPFLDLVWCLRRCLENDEEEAILMKLDLAISDLRRSYPPKA